MIYAKTIVTGLNRSYRGHFQNSPNIKTFFGYARLGTSQWPPRSSDFTVKDFLLRGTHQNQDLGCTTNLEGCTPILAHTIIVQPEWVSFLGLKPANRCQFLPENLEIGYNFSTENLWMDLCFNDSLRKWVVFLSQK